MQNSRQGAQVSSTQRTISAEYIMWEHLPFSKEVAPRQVTHCGCIVAQVLFLWKLIWQLGTVCTGTYYVPRHEAEFQAPLPRTVYYHQNGPCSFRFLSKKVKASEWAVGPCNAPPTRK